jgi:hypothetical protein
VSLWKNNSLRHDRSLGVKVLRLGCESIARWRFVKPKQSATDLAGASGRLLDANLSTANLV